MKKHKKYFTTGNDASYCEVDPMAINHWIKQGLPNIFKPQAGHYCIPWESLLKFIKVLTHVSINIISAYINDDVIQELNELNIKVILNKPAHHKQLINKSREILALEKNIITGINFA